MGDILRAFQQKTRLSNLTEKQNWLGVLKGEQLSATSLPPVHKSYTLHLDCPYALRTMARVMNECELTCLVTMVDLDGVQWVVELVSCLPDQLARLVADQVENPARRQTRAVKGVWTLAHDDERNIQRGDQVLTLRRQKPSSRERLMFTNEIPQMAVCWDRLTNPRSQWPLPRSGHSVTTDNHNTNHTAPQISYSDGVHTLPPDITPRVLTNGQGQPGFEPPALATAVHEWQTEWEQADLVE